ncbi:MAG: hypothetical protein ABSH46_02650 [Bryobacteraceae bacterium]|jgi:hypothetical protein
MDDEVVQMPYGLARAGLGHLGDSPAAINVVSVRDVTVELAAPPVMPSRTLSVCEVLADDPTKLNGQVVAVRGLLQKTQEGLSLRGECKSHLVTRGVTWENVLAVSAEAADENADPSWRRMSDKLTGLHASLSRERVWVTIVGRLKTLESMDDELIQEPDGLRKAGFGRMSDSAAEIEDVMSVQDVTVERPRPPGSAASPTAVLLDCFGVDANTVQP